MFQKLAQSFVVAPLFVAAFAMIAGCRGEVVVKAHVPEPEVKVAVVAPVPVVTAAVVVAPVAPPPPHKHEHKRHEHIVLKDNRIPLPGPVVFETGTSNLKPESEPVLDVVEDYLVQEPSVNMLRVEGNTDSDGDKVSNMALSKARALAVAAWLVAQGVDCKRLYVVGYGDTAPVAPNTTDDGKQQNRRVDFVKAMEHGKAVVDAAGRPLATDGGKGAQNAGNPCG